MTTELKQESLTEYLKSVQICGNYTLLNNSCILEKNQNGNGKYFD